MKNLRKYLIITFFFTLIGLIANSIEFVQLEGSNQAFTFFEFIAPASSGILPLPIAMISVALVKAVEFITDPAAFSLFSIVRVFLPLVAVSYFANREKWNEQFKLFGNVMDIAIPVIAIIGFNIHPVGRQVWYYSLMWLIPVVSFFLKDKLLLARSLGATFSQHALGGLLFLYLVPGLGPELFVFLIPIVLKERLIYALGISGFYLLSKDLIHMIEKSNNQFVIRFRKLYAE